ncbi:alpha/beta hydrolase family protein [Aerococcus kribbianus]|uniref:Alpha/beta hydrolase n=1 Tax=Aerococcus kribbianus TaxID=2999064 RepID=A0A9X3JEC3_9LACT|nr:MULTISPECIES: alpha/beta hydrolase [unclassified Aerococcus]MCZ0716944.1 alpha/beta hydrolase [Aerococcus sp. YH-aer221]MCZ0725232.1 alpha/beta hydrolase [Aerococcus sp. YH-aer222]
MGGRHSEENYIGAFPFLTICMGIFITVILYSGYKLWDNGFFESELVEYHYRLNGRDVYSIEYQSDFDKFYDKPILLALHGSQRSSENYKTKSEEGVSFYIYQKERALENNYRSLSISLDTDVWGNQDGIESLKKLYQLEGPRDHYNPYWTLWATSAGGVNAYRMIAEQPDLFQKMIGTFPVYDTAQMTINNPRAYSYWDRYYNPADHPEKLSQANFLIFHGRDDDVVDLTLHSGQLKNDLPENTTLIDTVGGHSTDNFYIYNDDLINDFLNYDIQL